MGEINLNITISGNVSPEVDDAEIRDAMIEALEELIEEVQTMAIRRNTPENPPLPWRRYALTGLAGFFVALSAHNTLHGDPQLAVHQFMLGALAFALVKMRIIA